MRNITILLLSDIHLKVNPEAEGQGLVISEFFKDFPSIIRDVPFEDRYCVISGDLVQAGGLMKSYQEFKKRCLDLLIKHIPLSNIICVPGNHDLNRNYVENHQLEYENWRNSKDGEEVFNAQIKDNEYFNKAFEPFNSFRESSLAADGQNIFGFSKNLIPQISVMCLNTAILSNGGLDEKTIVPPFPKDRGNLRIETSTLFDWCENNDGRTKVLVMHHPIEDLTEYAQHQLTAIVNNKVDILITGHTHFQKYEPRFHNGRPIHIMTSPQLYSNKKDINGYSLLHFRGAELSEIEYRQWSQRNNHFMAGVEFADNDSGRVIIETKAHKQDIQHRILETKLQESLLIFNYNVPWCNRVFSSTLTPRSAKDEKKIDYLDILNGAGHYQIVAPPQFGLTSFARYLAYNAGVVKGENWVYLDVTGCNHSNIENKIRFASNEVGFDIKEVKGVILDNWNGQQKDRMKILDRIGDLLPEARILLLSNIADAEVLAGIDTEESHKGYQLFYMRELSRASVRTLVEAFNADYQISETNLLLDRLLLDIESLNEHRTPLNCMQLLMAYRSNFASHPVNRSRVLELVLDIIFKNSNTLYYNDALNEKDCCNIMGVIAHKLFNKNTDSFDWEEFKSVVSEELPLTYTEGQLRDLLVTLTQSQILVQTESGYKFRFVYWVYYFVAFRMYASDQCFEEMVVQNRHYYNSDIVEFYSAIDPRCDRLVTIVIERMAELVQTVNTNIGRPFWNPYDGLKWNMNESQKGKTTVQVEAEINASRLPDEIKDSIKDINYDAVKPYNQPIKRLFDEYEVNNLMQLTRAASRALRNSQFVDSTLLVALRNQIYAAWVELFKVLILITPALAQTGYGGYGGARFKLEGNFSEELEECIKQIIFAIPFNIILWYKEDFFSEKRVAMYYDAMVNSDNPVIRHLNARVIAECRPAKWRDMINKYISTVGKNSFYLVDIDSSLRRSYQLDSMSDEDLRTTKGLILTCYTKHKEGGALPSLTESNKNADKAGLPKRLTE